MYRIVFQSNVEIDAPLGRQVTSGWPFAPKGKSTLSLSFESADSSKPECFVTTEGFLKY